MPAAEATSQVDQFCDYMFTNYIAPDAKYAPYMWAADPTSITVRTTNAAEAFHRHIKQIVKTPHPNIYILANNLLEIQEETYIKLQSQSKSPNVLKDAIQLFYRYSNGGLNRLQYLKRICFKYLPVPTL